MEVEKEINQIEVSKKLFILLIVFLVGLTAFWGVRIAEMYNSMQGDYPREITVEGEGKAYAAPDMATLHLGVNTEAKTSEAAVEQNTEKMNKVIESVKAAGIEQEDIQTTNYYLSPNYEWSQDRGSYTDGYVLDQSLTIKIRDLENVSNVMSAASGAGATTMTGLTFEIEDPDKVLEEAREKAVAKAKVKAANIEKQSGLDLGKVVSYYEYQGNDFGYAKGGMYMEEMAMSSDSARTAPAIEPGQEEVSITVSITYKIK
jgi:uncharacterized protein